MAAYSAGMLQNHPFDTLESVWLAIHNDPSKMMGQFKNPFLDRALLWGSNAELIYGYPTMVEKLALAAVTTSHTHLL
jgi:hypothetical protein